MNATDVTAEAVAAREAEVIALQRMNDLYPALESVRNDPVALVRFIDKLKPYLDAAQAASERRVRADAALAALPLPGEDG